MICNTGVGLTPRLDGDVLRFREQGLYDGLFLMADIQTGTWWSHMTGEALHGPLAGRRLPIRNLLHTTVGQLLSRAPEARVALSDHPRAMESRARVASLTGLLERIRGVPAMFPATMGVEDDRRPRMDLGIGLWSDDGTARYYPLDVVQGGGGFLFDGFAGGNVLVYYDPVALALLAVHTDATGAEWDGEVLRLSDGSRIEEAVLVGPEGERLPMNRPMQVFTRWYGFSLSFSDAEIYEAGGGSPR